MNAIKVGLVKFANIAQFIGVSNHFTPKSAEIAISLFSHPWLKILQKKVFFTMVIFIFFHVLNVFSKNVKRKFPNKTVKCFFFSIYIYQRVNIPDYAGIEIYKLGEWAYLLWGEDKIFVCNFECNVWHV